MATVNRRKALQMCMLCAAGVMAGGASITWATDHGVPDTTPAHEPLRQPDVLRSRDGRLDVRLEVTSGATTIAGRTATLLRYNGKVPGPTLLLHPGDRLSVELVNRSDEPTNLHTHGLVVSPAGHGDNPFVVVDPGSTFHYEYAVPADQPAGTCWYHPHHHGMAADQVFRGLYGAIVIEDAATGGTHPDGGASSSTPQRVLVISDITVDADGTVPMAGAMQRRMGREGDLLMINGQLHPRITTSPGTRERWHLVNACVSRFVRVRLDGQRLELCGVDLPLRTPCSVPEILLMPGNRADVIVTAGTTSSALQVIPVPRIAAGMSFGGSGTDSTAMGGRGMFGGGMGGAGMSDGGMGMGGAGMSDGGMGMGGGGMGAGMGVGGSGTNGAAAVSAHGPVDLAEFVVEGAPVIRPDGKAPVLAVPDLRGKPLTAHRTITLAMGMEMQGPVGMSFTIDGHGFDPARVDQRVPAGAVEQWTIVNTSEMDHPFHLHVWPMQVVRVGDVPAVGPTWQNVVNVPARSSTVVLIRFAPVTGRTVYHCHILDHEDAGMMGVVDVG